MKRNTNFIEKSNIYVEARPVNGKQQKEYTKLFEDTFIKKTQHEKLVQNINTIVRTFITQIDLTNYDSLVDV